MEQQIKDRYSSEVLQDAMHRYGITEDRIRPLHAFESFIYEFSAGENSFILRLAHSLRRNKSLIYGEVDWINYLAERGVPVAKAVASPGGNLVEEVPDGRGGQFLVTGFAKALGRSPWDLGWTPALYEAHGRLLGSMHVLARSYRPADPAWRRPAWDAPLFAFVDRYLPASEPLAREKYDALCAHLRTLPKSSESYGLIHQDAHGSNMLVDDGGHITLFDFDECAYSWFANDVAIALFYAAVAEEDGAAFTAEFMSHFLRGYRQVARLDAQWLQELPAFLKLREIELYAVMHRDFDVNNIEDPWCSRFMHERKYRIEHDIPFVDFDFTSLAPS